MGTKIRRSSDFRSTYATGVWLATSPTEVRMLFINNEPIEVDGEEEGAQAIQEVPHYQAEVIMNRQLAEWIRNTLDAYLKQQGGSTS